MPTDATPPLTPDACEVFLDTLRGLLDNTPKALGDLHAAEENVRQVYSDRFVFELLQNARDAAARRGEGARPRALLRLDGNVLLVANDGEPFSRAGYEAITGIGRSSKGASGGPKLIGKKGIGFKSVLRVSSAPQVFSRADGRTLALSFGDRRVRALGGRSLARDEAGFRALLSEVERAWLDAWLEERGVAFSRLSFPHAEGLRAERREAVLDRLPVMMFPSWCDRPPEDVAHLLDGEGYDTVIRLPLRPDHVGEVAERLQADVIPTKVRSWARSRRCAPR